MNAAVDARLAMDPLRQRLEARAAAGLLRVVSEPGGLDVSSNDYLGYAQDPELANETAEFVRAHGAGAGAARLLCGRAPLHEAAETALAALVRQESALLFSSGWSANTGLWAALASDGDSVFSAVDNHASTIDGLRLSRATRVIFRSVAELATLLAAPRRGLAFVAVESVQSMSGRLVDLEAICDLADVHGALVVVDEAHATGLYGPNGAGRVAALGLEGRVLCTLHTGGKALGVGGAWVAGSKLVRELLVNFARSFVYSTAPVPAIAGGLLAVLPRLAREAARVALLHRQAAGLRRTLTDAGLDLDGSGSCIVPVVLGTAQRALTVAAQLQADGFDARAIRPPTVPTGRARLRLVVRAPLTDADLARLAQRVIRHAGA